MSLPLLLLCGTSNGWEHAGGGQELSLSPTATHKDDFNDWWASDVGSLPADAFELNFVFHNADGRFDNNGNQDYVCAVGGAATTPQAWADDASARKAAAEAQRQSEEAAEAARLAAEAERRQADADASAAAEIVRGLRDGRAALEAGCVSRVPAPSSPGGDDGALLVGTKPPALIPGEVAVIVYNAELGPLRGCSKVRMQWAHNQWRSPTWVHMERQQTFAGSDVWHATIDVPMDAVCINAVFADENERYDNYGGQNFNLLVPLPSLEGEGEGEGEGGQGGRGEGYWEALGARVESQVRRRRLEKEAAAAALAEARDARKQRVRDYAREVARRKLLHMLVTDPPQVTAGAEVSLYYNIENTPLKGKSNESIVLKYGFNRWSLGGGKEYGKGEGKGEGEGGPAPIAMRPASAPAGADAGSWVTASLDVPTGAHMLDFVFSSGDTYDNNGGLDYHLEVAGGPPSPPLYVCHIAVEMAPIAKVGGLGDVVTALSRAVQEAGHHTEIILPRYDFLLASPLLEATTFEAEFDWGGCKNFVTTCIVEGELG